MKSIKIVMAVVLALGLSACGQGRDKEIAGSLLGAAAGGAIGSQIGSGSGNAIAIGAGVLIGGLIGNQVGRYMDDQDRQYAQRAAGQSFNQPTGSSSNWRNPDSGNNGSYTPVEEARRMPDGRVCRKVQSEYEVDGKIHTEVSTICRNPDGTVSAQG